MNPQATIEQMVRHVSLFEQNEVAALIDHGGHCGDTVTARLLFIKILAWIRTRATCRTTRPMDLPDYPWALTLKTVIETNPQLSNAFHVRDDKLDFNVAIPGVDIRRIESYVVENYKPIARR